MKFFKQNWIAALALLLVTLALLTGCDTGSAPVAPAVTTDAEQTVAVTESATSPADTEADPETGVQETEPETTEEPVTTAPAPETTAEPVTTAPAPETTEEPVTTVPAPETTVEPVTTVPAPETTEEPVTTTPAPETTKEPETDAPEPEVPALSMPDFKATDVPAFDNLPYVEVNGNIPFFTANQYTTESYEYYSPLDALGRCGSAVASIGYDLMPTEDRGSISSVKPTGWHSISYTELGIDSLYNRSHLIAFQLTGENANRENLITGTRYMNQSSMIPFENMVADYVKETRNHVLYRVTPIFTGDNLVADGVLMEGWSVEDNGDGICFCVYLYNVQPGIEIDYATGESRLVGIDLPDGEADYILNTNTMKFHYPHCSSVSAMSDKNKAEYFGSREELIEQGYKPCGNCKP